MNDFIFSYFFIFRSIISTYSNVLKKITINFQKKLTQCGYAKCHVTLIDEPAKNDVRVEPKNRIDTRIETIKRMWFKWNNVFFILKKKVSSNFTYIHSEQNKCLMKKNSKEIHKVFFFFRDMSTCFKNL